MLVEVVATQEVGHGIATLGEGVQVGTGFALAVHTAANGELVQNPRQAIAGEGLSSPSRVNSAPLVVVPCSDLYVLPPGVLIQIARFSCSILNTAMLEFNFPSNWLPLTPTSYPVPSIGSSGLLSMSRTQDDCGLKIFV